MRLFGVHHREIWTMLWIMVQNNMENQEDRRCGLHLLIVCRRDYDFRCAVIPSFWEAQLLFFICLRNIICNLDAGRTTQMRSSIRMARSLCLSCRADDVICAVIPSLFSLFCPQPTATSFFYQRRRTNLNIHLLLRNWHFWREIPPKIIYFICVVYLILLVSSSNLSYVSFCTYISTLFR
jgi:hypothetical protein